MDTKGLETLPPEILTPLQREIDSINKEMGKEEKVVEDIALLVRYLTRETIHRNFDVLINHEKKIKELFQECEEILKSVEQTDEVKYLLLDLITNQKVLDFLYDEESKIHKIEDSALKEKMIKQTERIRDKLAAENNVIFKIIDDLHKIRKNPEGKEKVLEDLKRDIELMNENIEALEKEFLADREEISDDDLHFELDGLYEQFKQLRETRKSWVQKI